MILLTKISEVIQLFFFLHWKWLFLFQEYKKKKKSRPWNCIILRKDFFMRFIDQRFHLLFYKHNWQNGVFKNKNFNNKNLSLNITFLLHFYVSVSVYILCKLKLHIKHWQWHSILKIISLFLSKIEYKCFYQWGNWILVSTSGYGQGFATFFFFFQFCVKKSTAPWKVITKIIVQCWLEGSIFFFRNQ